MYKFLLKILSPYSFEDGHLERQRHNLKSDFYKYT